ncbi:tail fiber protein [Lactobacillus phage P2]|nr:tail fiber protein [Lactobacillus phage P2]
MSRSAFVEVNITNPTRLAQDSQDTANKAVKGVENLNDPNLMNVIEKQNNIVQFAGLTSQYSVLVQNAKDEGIDTTAVTTAYNNLNIFMADILADPDHASDIDRARYKKYQDAYNEELAKLQNDLQNNTNDKFTSAANAISQAASTANVAKSAADSAYTYANSEIAVQSTATAKAQSAADSAFSEAQKVGEQTSAEIAKQSEAIAGAQSKADSALSKAEEVDGKTSAEIAKQSAATAKAQSTADSAFKEAQSATAYTDKQIASQASAVSEVSKTATEASSKANSALDTANGANAEIMKLKGGSTATIAKLEDGLGTKVSNDTFDSYQTQTASQFAQTVKEADFKTYQTQTSKLIESKVDNGTYQTDKTQTAEAIASKVSSGEFKTYQTQTDKALASKVSGSDYESDREQTASQIADKVSNGEFSTYKTQTDKLIGSKVDNGAFKTYQTQTAELINSKVDNGTYQSDKTQTANQIASKVSSADFNSYKSQTDKAIISKVESSDFQSLQNQVQNSAVGANLIVQSGLEYGYLDRNTGGITSGGGDFHSENYIATNGATVFTFSSPDYVFKGAGNHTLAMYDSDKNYLGYQAITSPTQTLSKSNVAYIRFSMNFTDEGGTAGNLSDWLSNHRYKLEKGSVATDYSVNPEDQATQSQITQLSGQIDQKVSSGDFNSYKTQTDKLIGQKVDNGAFKTYQNQTAELIESKVDNGTYQSDKTQTVSQIASKVSSDDFKSYQAQTDKAIESKVDNGTYQSDKTQTASQISDKVSNGAFNTYKTQTDKLIAEKVSNGDFNTYKSQTAELISSKVATKDFSAYQATTAKAIESKVESSDFNTYKTQTAGEISSKVSSTDFNNLKISNRNLALNTATGFVMQGNNTTNQCLPFNTSKAITKGTTITVSFDIVSTTAIGTFLIQLIGGDWQQVTANGDNPLTTTKKHYTHTLVAMSDHTDGLQLRLDNATGKVTMTNFIISESSKEVSWTPAPEDQATQSQVTQLSNDINLRVTKNGLLDQINIQAGKTLISSSGQLTLSANSVFLDSANPVIMKSANIDKLLVGKKLTAADISANTFTTNNGTFTVKQDGSITAKNMTLNGGKLYSPTMNAGVINGSTINGTTFHSGDIISNPNNTAHYHSMTITPDGAYRSTYFDNAVGLQSIIESGGLQHKFRSMVAGSDGHFTAYNAALDGQGFHSQSGYTTSKDSEFNKPQTITGYVDVTPATGIYLSGPTQQISFAGNGSNAGHNGITMDAYGNIKGMISSATWNISSDNAKVAQFGIDHGGQNTIGFYRPTFVDEIGAIGGLANGRLFLHAQDGNAQMYLLNDGQPGFVSPTIYNRTYSNGANVYVTSYGRVGRSTSASKYKLAIARSNSTAQADRLMTLNPASWNDKVATEKVAESLSNGETPPESEINLNRHYGLIAEDLRDAGLDEFLITGKDGQIEGIEYDRLWTVLIPKIRQLNERINELERESL